LTKNWYYFVYIILRVPIFTIYPLKSQDGCSYSNICDMFLEYFKLRGAVF